MRTDEMKFPLSPPQPHRGGERVGVRGRATCPTPAPHPNSLPARRGERGQRVACFALVLLLASALFAQNVAIPDAEQLVGAPKGTALTGAALDAQTQEVASAIRCPVCQGLSIADSPSEMAVNMKTQVRSLLARGYTREQIETYFERSYGQFVLLRPKFQGVNGMVWVLPILALVLGVVIVAMKLRNVEKPQTTSNQQPATDEDDAYVSRVRDLVRGTK